LLSPALSSNGGEGEASRVYSFAPPHVRIMKLRFGFIGLGAMGLSHVRSIRTLCPDKAEVAALCAMNEANLEKALAEAPGAKVFKRKSDLIQSPLDAVFVSTPNFTHATLAEEILGSGKHLFLEKPIGITRDE